MHLDFAYIICSVISFVVAIVFHETAHGFAAYKLGDPTAKRAGRLSLNPAKHIDPFGTVILPLALMLLGWPVFGYAKPVPYNPRYFKDPRKGDFLVGIAGPLANVLLAAAAGVVAHVLFGAYVPLYSGGSLSGGAGLAFEYVLGMFLPMFALVNLYLAFFNLLPIPPLDGSSIFALVIPRKYLPKYYSVQRYALPVFMIVIVVVPYVTGFNPFSWYLDATAGNVANLLFPFRVS